ncbi:uncharacterized protein FOMMEDRAFT_28778 [Fomitiporia mediterranea MF3/22]|uniref:uncharacterized protein n=1 Tax=Fomitiporia mediterranea (strain MF3/22) TaxID=694068 RepID=UPI000440762E|nr:uncharacterized protein FOMMEDRAFT_28778 [Fomitiporia mediterranea MF3/22]EJD03236.1 hypothetical protein FOMMEDRAFT_28778 [Fomitiporia mediterranea MF3/22]
MERVIIVDSSRTISTQECSGLFSNCGKIIKIIPFDLPPKCLRDFPGLSHYFVQFAEIRATGQALQTYLPKDVKVDPLVDVSELVPLYLSLSETADSRTKATRNKRSKITKCQDRVAIVRCLPIYDKDEVRSALSTCGEITKIHDGSPTKPRKSTKKCFFVEFTREQDVDRARQEHFPGFEVVSLSKNTQWMSAFKKSAKVGRWAL